MTNEEHLTSVYENSKLTFEDAVIAKIAGKTSQNIDGILSMDGGFFSDIADKFRSGKDLTKGIDVEIGEKQVAIDMDILIEYGKSAKEIFEKLTKAVVQEVEQITGLTVIEVNVHVSDVLTKKEWQKQNSSKEEVEKSRVQ